MSKSIRILMVEDNPVDALLLQNILVKAGIAGTGITRVGSLSDAIKHPSAGEFDVILLDLSLPDAEGLETVCLARVMSQDVPIIVLTGTDDEETGIQSVKSGAEDYLIKGKIDGPLLVRSIQYAIERHRLKAEIRSLTLIDELTGLYNRRGFMTLGRHHIELARRTGRHILLYYADLDGLKRINDQLGHKSGDEALVNLADILRRSFRRTDVISRLGGDEFTVLVLGASLDDAGFISANIERNLREFNGRSGPEYRLSISYGIAGFVPDSDDTVEQLILRADQSLYEMKRMKIDTRFIKAEEASPVLPRSLN